MATYDRGTIVYLGDYGIPESNISKSVFGDILSAAALGVLATGLDAYTDANISAKIFHSHDTTGLSAPGANANMDVKAQIVLKDSADGTIKKFLIPAPVSTMFVVEGQGDRVSSVALAAIVGLVNTATGKTFVGLYGKKIQKA